MRVNSKLKVHLMIILFLQLIFFILVVLNTPVARQVIGFVYLTFVPGAVVMMLLKMKTDSLTEAVLFATGLSIAFLMFIGLLVNQLKPLLNVSKPLSWWFLLPAINIFVLACMLAVFLRGEGEHSEPAIFRVVNPLIISLLMCIPALSIVGAITSGAYNDNRIIIFTIIAIAALFVTATISRKTVFTRLYPLIVFNIAISLTYHSALVSEGMVSFGSDVGGEVFVQKIVEKNAYWNPVNPYPWDQSVGRAYAMLSVTMLPTIYSTLLNMDTVLVFKLFYSMFLALVPLGLYNLWKKFLNEKIAFISAFFFMAFQPFYGELLGLNKQILGELFLVLLLMVLLNGGKGRFQRTVCLIIFSFGLIVSHYALAEIFLFFSLFVLAFSIITRKPSRKITVTFVLMFSAMMFAWYLFTSSSAVFESFLSFGEYVIRELHNFFSLESREPEVLRGLGLEPPPTIWNMISRVFAYATEALIVIGFASIILKKSRIYLDKDYFYLVFCSMLFLGALIIVPGLSSTMNMTRFYHVLLFFIAPLCVIGAESIIKFLTKHEDMIKTSILLVMILVPYFLFQTSFVYELTNSPSWSLSLSKYRMSQRQVYCTFGYAGEQYISAARWLSNGINVKNVAIYAEPYSRTHELRAYGGIWVGYVEALSNVTQFKTRSVVYLNPLNVIEGTVIRGRYFWNTTDLQFLNDMNNVYNNGGSEIFYKHVP